MKQVAVRMHRCNERILLLCKPAFPRQLLECGGQACFQTVLIHLLQQGPELWFLRLFKQGLPLRFIFRLQGLHFLCVGVFQRPQLFGSLSLQPTELVRSDCIPLSSALCERLHWLRHGAASCVVTSCLFSNSTSGLEG